MNTSIFKPFTEWVTQLRKSATEDALVRARLRTALIFMGFCTISFFLVGFFVDNVSRSILIQLSQNVLSAEEASARIEQVRWIARISHILVIGVAIYLLMGLSFRPVRQAIESQRRFTAQAAHELRTPLAVAKAETEVALRSGTTLSQEELLLQLGKNLSRLDHLSRIIQFLLVLSELSAPGTDSFTKTVSLDAVIRSSIKRYEQQATHAGVTLSFSSSVSGVMLQGNAIALEKLLDNLLRNALAYVPEGGEVRVTLERVTRSLVLAVEDTGPGIPASERTLVFDPFYRAATARPGGSGLGLSIVREIARMHHAQVRAGSSPEGGARLEVLFTNYWLSPRA